MYLGLIGTSILAICLYTEIEDTVTSDTILTQLFTSQKVFTRNIGLCYYFQIRFLVSVGKELVLCQLFVDNSRDPSGPSEPLKISLGPRDP